MPLLTAPRSISHSLARLAATSSASWAPGALRGGRAVARVVAADDAPPPGHETHFTAFLTLSIIFSAVCLTFPTVWSS
jgi:hypothetical protein